MGLFTSWFGRSGGGKDTAESANDEEGQFPELNHGITLNLETPDGQHILTGQLSNYSAGDGTLTIERMPGGLSFETCEIGASVTIRGVSVAMTQFFLKGTVQESTRTICRLKDVRTRTVQENRDNLRLQIGLPATIYHEADEALRRPEECVLVDIGTGGACIESEYLHAVDEVLRLKVKLQDYIPMEFLGEIIRMVEYKPGKFRYGFLFARLSERELDDLTRTLYNIQSGSYTAWMRTEVGYWGTSL